MQSSVEMESSDLSGLPVCRLLESYRAAVKLRQIIVPVDLTHGCPASIDYAICFAKVCGSTASGLNIFCSEDVWTWRTLHVQSW